MEHPKAIGNKTALAVMLALLHRGYEVLTPFGENTRYDLVIDDGRRLMRVQCKTGRLRDGAVRFATCSSYGHHRNPLTARRSYAGQIDAFAVHCPETGGVYLIAVDELQPRAQACLRVNAPKNRQKRFIRFAGDYEIARIDVQPFEATPAA